MRLSHIYQPVMIRILLENGGEAAINKIANEFLREDRSQQEYYEQIIRRMPQRSQKAACPFSSWNTAALARAQGP